MVSDVVKQVRAHSKLGQLWIVMFRFSKSIRALWAGWVGLLVQDGPCAANLNLHF